MYLSIPLRILNLKRTTVLRNLLPYTKPVRYSAVGLGILSLLGIPVGLISPRFFQILVDEVLTAGETNKFVLVVVGLISVYLIRLLFDSLGLYFGNRLSNNFSLPLRKKIFDKISRIPYRKYETNEIGDLKMRVMDDVDCIGGFIREQIVDLAISVLTTVLTVVIAFLINPAMTAFCLAVMPLVFLINHAIGKGTRAVNEDIRKKNEEYNTSTHGSLTYWREIKAQSAENTFIARFEGFREQLARLGYRWIRFWAFGEVFGDFKANYLTKVLVYVIGAFFVMRGRLSVGVVLMFGEYFAMLFGALDSINGKQVALKVNSPYYERVFDTLSWSEESCSNSDFDGVKVSNLSFGYSDEPVLKDVNFEVSPGEKVAIMGESGCGKSTLAKILAGLYSPDEAENCQLSTVHCQLVSQDPFVFNMSIRGNLRIANAEAGDDELREALSNAAILDFVDAQPEGLDTIIGEGGVKLSGGQRQRLCIARALLAQPKLLILDEATSALDMESEAAVIDNLSADMTVIIISHRPELTAKCDRKYVMKDGRLYG